MLGNNREVLKRRKENRLRELYNSANECAKAFNLNKEIKIKEMSGEDINKIKNRTGFVDCVQFKREYLHICTGLLEIEFIPNLVMKRLLAAEMAHVFYKDHLLDNMKKDFLFTRKLRFSHVRALIIVMSELRADIAATKVMGLTSDEDIEGSNLYSGFDLLTCYKEQGYPDAELRTYICCKYKKFTRKTIEEVFYLYKRNLNNAGIKLNITLDDLDKFVATLNPEWSVNWPQKENVVDTQEIQKLVREMNQ